MFKTVRIGIVVSVFNSEITEKLLAGCLSHLQAAGILENQIEITKVPGAIEVPLLAKLLAKTQSYHAIICLGCVIRGDTDHYDYVCQQVSYGCQKVMLKYELPIVFGILTTSNLQQAYDRVGGTEGHKGIEAAQTALEMIQLISHLNL